MGLIFLFYCFIIYPKFIKIGEEQFCPFPCQYSREIVFAQWRASVRVIDIFFFFPFFILLLLWILILIGNWSYYIMYHILSQHNLNPHIRKNGCCIWLFLKRDWIKFLFRCIVPVRSFFINWIILCKSVINRKELTMSPENMYVNWCIQEQLLLSFF